MRDTIVMVSYFIAAFLFIFGIKQLAHPKTARRGNQIAAGAMLLAIVATLVDRNIISYWTIIAGTIVGGGIGTYYGHTVKMTAMPQMVALFNGMGGGTAALVSVAEYVKVANGCMNSGI